MEEPRKPQVTGSRPGAKTLVTAAHYRPRGGVDLRAEIVRIDDSVWITLREFDFDRRNSAARKGDVWWATRRGIRLRPQQVRDLEVMVAKLRWAVEMGGYDVPPDDTPAEGKAA